MLDVDPEWIDLRRFERLVADGRFTHALGLWRGELLADFPDADFVTLERSRVDELRLHAIESHIVEQLAAGDRVGIGDLAELVEEYPLRERLTSSLMLALYRAGRQVEALRAFDRHRRRLAEEVGVDPANSLKELHGAILRHDPTLEPGRLESGNLPQRLTSFIGRSDDFASIGQTITDNRLVTFTGPGGVGKTRLSIEVGSRLAPQFPGGVWLADLAGVDRPGEVAETVATTLNIDTRHAADVLTAIVTAIAHRQTLLVVLDNCEHLVESVAAMVSTILTSCQNVHIVATSRCPLGVDGEFVRPVHPLAHADAAQLFVDRARLTAAQPSDDAAREICRRLDGLPLAIELAASQLRLLAPTDIVARLDDRLTFRRPTVVVPRRQRTLGDMVRWSYDLLPPATQRVFDRIGVFAGTLSLTAAEAVCATGGAGADQVFDHITTLIDHSLLAREQVPGSGSRYRLLETLRIFALERLDEVGGEESARRAHAEFFRSLATESGSHLYGPHELDWRRLMEADEANLQAAKAWTGEHDPLLALELGVALWPYCEARWKERQGVAFLERLLDLEVEVPADLRAWALTAAAMMASNGGDARRAVGHAAEALAAFRLLGDDHGVAEALAALGSALANQGRFNDAEAALAEALQLFQRLDRADRVAIVVHGLSYVAMRRGDHEESAKMSRQELAAMQSIGSRRGEAGALRHLAIALQNLDDYDGASALCREALEIWQDIDDPAAVAHVQTTLADIARCRGDLAVALELYHEARAGLHAIGDRRCSASTDKNLAVIAAHRGEHREAHERLRRALALRHELGDEAGLCEILEAIAALDGTIADDDAAVLLGAAAAIHELAGSHVSPADLDAVAGTTAVRRGRLGAAQFEECYDTGRQMTVDAIVEFATDVNVTVD